MNVEELMKKLEAQNAEIQFLRSELAKALESLALAHARIEQLEGQAAKDSHNSSKPPSTDGFKEPVRKTQSLRGKSGKKSGGQPGHQGRTLMMVEHPDEIVTLTPTQCYHCQQDLSEASICREERVQVFDLPAIRLQVREYRAEVKACPHCQTETRASFPEGVKASSVQYGPNTKALAVYLHGLHLLPLARVCQILNDLLGTSFSQASVLSAFRESGTVISPVLEKIKTALCTGTLVHNDETGFRIDKKRWWLHVACTRFLTLYLAHVKRGKEGTDAMEILPNFHGTSIHDTFASYQHYDCTHALCNAHYLRELTFIHERYEQLWAKEMKVLLLEIKSQVSQVREQGMTCLPPSSLQAFEDRYTCLVEQGFAANPPPERKKGQQGALRQGDVRNLLLRLRQYRQQILRFMHDFVVPFDNNLAESDLRMMKLRQKISGCFRTEEDAAVFCGLRSYLSTQRKQGVHLLTALRSVFLGSPLLPPLLEAE
jgi:transposase